MDDLFDREEMLLNRAEALMADDPPAPEALRSAFGDLLVGYRKLFRESKRLLRMGDRQERHLRKMAQELRETLAENERLRERALDSNPLTQLPGHNAVAREIERALDQQAAVTVVYSDIDNFKAYNDRYGFSMGDRMIGYTADVLRESVEDLPAGAYFLGHIGGDDFVLLLPSEEADRRVREIARRFDAGVPRFYSDEDNARGHIEAMTRQGIACIFPLASLSLAGVDLARNRLSRFAEVASVCAELKRKAKETHGRSSFILDRRRGHTEVIRRATLRLRFDEGTAAAAPPPSGNADAAEQG